MWEDLGHRRSYATDDVLVREGSPSREVLVIQSGRVKIVTVGPGGRDAMLGVRGPGDLIGDVSAIDGRPRSASAVALEPVDATVMATSTFIAFLEREPAAALSLLRVLAHRLRDADDTRRVYSGLDATGRVASRLLELAEQFGRPDGVIDLPITQEDLSGWTGSSLEATAKALRVLRVAGVVATARKRIEVTDVEGLRLYVK